MLSRIPSSIVIDPLSIFVITLTRTGLPRMCISMFRDRGVSVGGGEDFEVRLADGTEVKEPGKTGSSWPSEAHGHSGERLLLIVQRASLSTKTAQSAVKLRHRSQNPCHRRQRQIAFHAPLRRRIGAGSCAWQDVPDTRSRSPDRNVRLPVTIVIPRDRSVD